MKKMSRGEKCVWAAAMAGALALLVACASGCATLDRAYKQEVTWSNSPVVMERTNVVYLTNGTTGAVWGYLSREPVATNLVAAVVTNFVPVFYTNVVQVPVTNLSLFPASATRPCNQSSALV